MFSILNFIAQQCLTLPYEISAMYNSLPKKAKEAVEKRDSKTK